MSAEEDSGPDTREHYNIVFIGHVDAGKSTLSGQILYLTGEVDQRTIEKYEKEAKEKNRQSWWLAFIMDTNEEERAKGKTVEVGRAPFSTEHNRFTILDAPGHKKYVPNMIAGASQADVAVLVVSARKGEFETGFDRGGQTREHAMLAKTLGVQRLIVVVNKMDDDTVEWSQKRFDQIRTKISPYLKQVGYRPRQLPWVPISAYSGANVQDPVDKSTCSWYDGPSLLQVFDGLDGFNRTPEGALRLPVLDKFKDRGTSTALGKIESGTVRVGDKVLLLPNRVETEISSITLDTGDVQEARCGENVQVGLKGTDMSELSPGMMICSAKEGAVCKVSDTIGAKLAIMNMGDALFTAGFTAVMHIHTATVEVEVERLVEQLKPVAKKNPRFVQDKSMVSVVLKLERPICVELFENYQQLGRFTLRTEGASIAIGKVMRIKEMD